MRGLTALGVVLTHAVWEVFPAGDCYTLPPVLAAALQPIVFANKVAVFIVVSGFCIGLSVLRRPGLEVKGGPARFLRRRCRRILPAYYAAMAASLALILLVPSLQSPTGARWDAAVPALEPGAILSHVFLVHNLNPHWLLKIDPPMWSLAIEWQMYFLFLFLLLPIWRRWGIVAATVCGLILGYLPHWLLSPGFNYDWTAPWYLGLFCLGMAAATVARTEALWRFSRMGVLITGGVVVLVISRGVYWWAEHRMLIDLLMGIFASCVLLYGACSVKLNRSSRLNALLERGWLRRLGVVSYSLYLVHFPLLSALHALLRYRFDGQEPTPLLTLVVMFVVGVPLSIWGGRQFYERFERPYIRD
jgi:peptidoglycan/LPS O-acetylase OafA/YrhL